MNDNNHHVSWLSCDSKVAVACRARYTAAVQPVVSILVGESLEKNDENMVKISSN
jgi:hypothetical protein